MERNTVTKDDFESLAEALDYGYELKSSVPHKDVTVGGYGYDLLADDGRVAVPVYTGDKTPNGKWKTYRMMFPPKK